MTLHRITFNIYEVIFHTNVCLNDDSMVKTIIMGSIVARVKTKGKTTRIRITDVLHVSKLQTNLLSMSIFLSKVLKVQFHINECIVGSANGDVVAIA